MLNDENKELCQQVLEKHGIQHQRMMTIEECSELQKAICKLFRSDTPRNRQNLREELIDTINMCQQMLMAEGITMEYVNLMIKAKLTIALKGEKP